MSDNLSVSPDTKSASAKENLQASKSHALQAAEELRAAAGAKASQLKEAAETRARQFKDVASDKAEHLREVASDRATQVKGKAEGGWEDTRTRARDLHAETEDYVRENPTKAVLTALGVGFFIGLIFRR
ncbi:MAG: YqjD family protein [Verrucomicrobiales bacterium]